jgi:hypothetical protein
VKFILIPWTDTKHILNCQISETRLSMTKVFLLVLLFPLLLSHIIKMGSRSYNSHSYYKNYNSLDVVKDAFTENHLCRLSNHHDLVC